MFERLRRAYRRLLVNRRRRRRRYLVPSVPTSLAEAISRAREAAGAQRGE